MALSDWLGAWQQFSFTSPPGGGATANAVARAARHVVRV
jgi:hypothetical protein